MASDLRIRVGGVTATISLNGENDQVTDVQVAAALERFMRGMAIPIEGTNVEKLTRYLEHVKDETRRVAKRIHRQDLEAGQRIQNDAIIEVEYF